MKFMNQYKNEVQEPVYKAFICADTELLPLNLF